MSYNMKRIRSISKIRKEKRIEATLNNKPIHKGWKSYSYWFPKSWDWHERVQFIAKEMKNCCGR